MASPIEAVMLLCDAATADPSGKLHMLGAGWSLTVTPTIPSAVAILLKVPWDRTNQQIPLVLALVDADGHEVVLPGGSEGLKIQQTLEVGRPPGVSHGTRLEASFAFSVPSLPLQPGRYEWRLDAGDNRFTASFEVRGPAAVVPTGQQ
ncbi:MAG: DUF6941 family protein [Angustibacter sp.]